LRLLGRRDRDPARRLRAYRATAVGKGAVAAVSRARPLAGSGVRGTSAVADARQNGAGGQAMAKKTSHVSEIPATHLLRRAGVASLAGQTLGNYTLERSIGEGGMGSVWLAHRSDGRYAGQVAVKLLNASLIGQSGGERFRREGAILARLAHPNIARLIDAGVT